MQKSKTRQKLHGEKPPLPLSYGAVLSYLEDLGASADTLLRVIEVIQSSLQKEEALARTLEGLYDDYHRSLRSAKVDSDSKFLDGASITLRAITEARLELDAEKQSVWINVAKESGHPELAYGLGGIPRPIAEEKLDDRTVDQRAHEHFMRGIAKMAISLARIRKERGLTLDQVAKETRRRFPFTDEAHITAPHLHKAENAKTLLSPLKLMAVSQVYGLPFDVFLTSVGLPDLIPRMKEMARELVIGAFGSIDDAERELFVQRELELKRVQEAMDQIKKENAQLVRERESLDRQLRFLEAEVETLRSAGKVERRIRK